MGGAPAGLGVPPNELPHLLQTAPQDASLGGQDAHPTETLPRCGDTIPKVPYFSFLRFALGASAGGAVSPSSGWLHRR